MKILFDQGTPVPLRRHLSSHIVDTAFERGWSALSNGGLLDVMEQEGYEILITTDQNLRYQQHLADRQYAPLLYLFQPRGRVYNYGSQQYKLPLRVALSGGTRKSTFDG